MLWLGIFLLKVTFIVMGLSCWNCWPEGNQWICHSQLDKRTLLHGLDSYLGIPSLSSKFSFGVLCWLYTNYVVIPFRQDLFLGIRIDWKNLLIQGLGEGIQKKILYVFALLLQPVLLLKQANDLQWVKWYSHLKWCSGSQKVMILC